MNFQIFRYVLCVVVMTAGMLSGPVKPVAAQTASATSSGKPMTNADVLALVQAGLGDDIVIAKIQAAPSTSFDTSVAGLTLLKGANVSPAVVRTMIQPHPETAGIAGMPQQTAVGDPDDPKAPHAPGLYVLSSTDGHTHMIRLDPEHPRGTTSNGRFVHIITHGIASSKTQSVLDGAKSAIELTQPHPEFYAYMPESTGSFMGGLNIKDLVLTKLEVKGDTRLWTFGEHGLFSSNEIGNDQKARQGFSSERVSPGVYKLTLAGELAPGQYAFMLLSEFFDFGIQPAS